MMLIQPRSLSHRRSAEQNDFTRGKEAKNVEDDGYPSRLSHKSKSTLHLRQKSSRMRDDSYSLEWEGGRTREANRQDPKLNQHNYDAMPGALPLRPRLQEFNVVDVSTVRLTNINETTESRQDLEEFSGNSLYHHLCRVMTGCPSKHFKRDGYPCSPAGIETAVGDLILAFESNYSKICKWEEDFKTKEKEWKFLRMANDQLADKNKKSEKMNAEHDKRVKMIQQDHQSEKQAMIEIHEGEKKRLEDEMTSLEKQHREEMVHIESSTKEEMKRMKKDYDKKIHQSDESLRLATEHYEKQLETVHHQYKEDIRQMLDSFDIENLTHYEKLLETVYHQHEEEKRQMLGSFDIEKSRMKKEFHDQKAHYVKLLETAHHQDGEEKQKMKREFHDEKAKLSSAMESQKKTFESRLTDLKIESENSKQRMTAEHHAVKNKIMEGERTAMAFHLQELEDHYHKKMRIMQDQYNQELRKKDGEVEEVKKKQRDQGKLLEKQHAADKLRLEKKEEEHRKLRGDIEALKRVLVKRDRDLKSMNDRELALRFQDLASELDDFSRVQWDNRREATWPFSGRVLRESGNERRSKQHVIKNTIWVILYERIFCTPFRVFGTEGKLMEQDWTEKYGLGELQSTSLNLPDQTTDTEFNKI